MGSNKIWEVTLIDPEDGTGDVLVELPEELLATIGWVEGELLKIEQVDKCVVLKKSDSKS